LEVIEMTVTMKTKNQITIPKKITNVLGLEEGTMFRIEISGNRIELIPLEVSDRVFTKAEYEKLEFLAKQEHGKEKRVTKRFIRDLEKAI
jgi:AbrB family looped-hinge helix DNA binding protein